MRDQPVAMHVEIDQREGRAQPLVILPDAPVSHLGKSEDPFEDAERMFDFGSHASLGGVLALGLLIHIVLLFDPARNHVLRLRRGSMDGLGLALISAVAPHLALFAVQ